LKKGQVAITKDSETPDDIGVPAYIAEDFKNVVLGYHLALITPYSDKLDGQFLNYYFHSKHLQKYFENNAGGSGQRYSLSINTIKEIPLFLPNFQTQTAIARILSSLDDKIELNNKINKELENLARGVYDYWFVKNASKKWERKSLYDIAIFTNGLACQKFRPKENEFYRVIKIKEMREGFTKDTELVDANIPKNVIVNDGDILFSWSASLEVMIWVGGIGGLNQHIFKVTSNEYPKSFIYFQLLNYLDHFRAIAKNRKTTMGHITIEHLKQSEIYIPLKDIINKVDKIVSPIFSKIIKNRQESDNLAKIRDFLLPLLMSGEVRVNTSKF
jgi:type I restriction enzyme S subunit